MKYSKFNTIVKVSNQMDLLYNAYQDKYIFLRKGEVCIDGLPEKDSNIYDRLCNEGFIINDKIDEIALIRKRQEDVDFQTNTFYLTINPTVNCNFHCWYCYEKHKPTMMNKKTIENIKLFFNHCLNKFERISVSFFGGEPLLYFQEVMVPLVEWIDEFSKKRRQKVTFSITTNAYLLDDKKIDFLKKYHFDFLQITLDGGEKFHNKTRFSKIGVESYNEIVDNIKKLVKKGINVILRINYTAENIESVKSIPLSFSELSDDDKLKIHVSMHQVWQDKGSSKESVLAAMQQFRVYGFHVQNQLLNNIMDSCYADKQNSAVINYNGYIYKCTAIDFDSTEPEGILTDSGEIEWKNELVYKRMHSKLKNKECLKCKILPICNSCCSQRAMQYADYNGCIRGFGDSEKEQAIMDKLAFNVIYNENWKQTIQKE